MNNVAIETKFRGKIIIQLADFVDKDWFSTVCVEEISVQILEFVDKVTNFRRMCSTVLRGN